MEPYIFTIPALGKMDVNASGNRIYCENATGVFYLKSGNQTLKMKAKRSYILREAANKFLLENPSNVPLDVEVHIGFDEIVDNEVLITGTIAGDVNIVNSTTAGKTVIKVDDDQTQAELLSLKTEVQGLRNELKAGNDLRYPLLSLVGATFATVTNANTVIVPAASNVNGIIVERIITVSSVAAACFLYAGTSLAHGQFAPGNTHAERLLLPSGVEMRLQSGGANTSLYIWYRILP